MKYFEKAAMEVQYNGLVAMYQVSIPIPGKMINYGSRMDKTECEKKWEDMKRFYPSQSYLPLKRFKFNERINGKIANAYAIEAYSINSFKRWKKGMQTYQLKKQEKKFLKDNLQDIKIIRGFIEKKCEGE